MRRGWGRWRLLAWRKGDLIAYHNYLTGGCSQVTVSFFSQTASDRGHGFQLHFGRMRLDIREEFLHRKGCKALELTTQESAGFTFPGSVQEAAGRYGLVDKVVIVPWLDLMVLEIYSNLNDSIHSFIYTFDGHIACNYIKWFCLAAIVSCKVFVCCLLWFLQN